MEYSVLYHFQSVLDPSLNILEIKLNIDTSDKSKKYFWLCIDTQTETVYKLVFKEMKEKNNMNIRVFDNTKLSFNNTNAIYQGDGFREIYMKVSNVSDVVNDLIIMYLS